jgi:predicted transcriptional regulator
MFENRRSEIEIIGELLTLSRNGARKTELLYRGNLSYKQLQNYLAFLLEKNVLTTKTIKNGNNSSSTIYLTTENGMAFLADIDKVLTYLK